ncbi:MULTISPECIES: hypothetical protein [Pseudomonadaceae]|jgi:hypothetical protein|uniref:Lipoprotein n=1 Tax=Metapseudomonas otitidis TaxID=319939 RepID=A0A7X3HA94_9GAMM|nr:MULTISPECIES: hypothetical protein [Pseudomonas]MDU9395698.1 hypothetical protein [Pseudomonas sp. zfem003]MWK58273.1 hypothetical protein [Pseudomonas otitidis]
MKGTRPLAVLALALALATGCSTQRPVLNPHEPVPPSLNVSQSQMQAAILAALQARDWTPTRVTPTEISASINVRNRHRAEIAIAYSPLDFDIQYRNSSGLNYENGEIHRNYNRWVNNLSNTILREIQTRAAIAGQ